VSGRVRWTSRAECDLEEIAYHIGVTESDPRVATALIDAICAKCEGYANQPEMGTLEEHLGDGLRCFVSRPFVVVYRRREDGIDIVRVVHGSRDYPELFT